MRKHNVQNGIEMSTGLTPRQLRGLFVVIEINVLLWLCVCGAIWQSGVEPKIRHLAVAGMVYAVLLQHWAYYKLFKKAKQIEMEQSSA